jgi:hypothetical protein
MPGLQTIINSCNGMTINRRKVVGLQITRNEIPRVSTTPTKNPWKFSLDMPSSLRYSDARQLMEALDTLDRTGSQDVTFGNNPCLSWIFRYQGSLSLAQIGAMTVQSFTSSTLVLTNLPAVASNRVIFEPNDLIQIGTNPYPFTSTTQVLRGTDATVTVTTHRPNIISSSVANNSITVGNACTFKVFCPNMPVYKLVPGGAKYINGNGIKLNNALLEFSDAFELYEFVGTS